MSTVVENDSAGKEAEPDVVNHTPQSHLIPAAHSERSSTVNEKPVSNEFEKPPHEASEQASLISAGEPPLITEMEHFGGGRGLPGNEDEEGVSVGCGHLERRWSVHKPSGDGEVKGHLETPPPASLSIVATSINKPDQMMSSPVKCK